MNKAIYIGPWKDFRQSNDFPEIKEFHYIDSQPTSEYGVDKDSYKDWFLDDLIEEIRKNNFEISEDNGENLMILKRGDQIIYYHYNTANPEGLENISHYIKDFKTLISVGHHPHPGIMNYTEYPVNLITYSCTVYDLDNDPNSIDNKNNIIQKLHLEKEYSTKFENFIFCDELGKHTYNSWTDLIIYYKSLPELYDD